MQSGILTVESKIQTSEESGILILGQFFWNPESTTDLDSGIQVVQSGIQVVESRIQGAESGIQKVESGIQGEESGIQGVYGSHYIREKN